MAIRACLVGAGRMGSAHAFHIARSPYVELYAVCDNRREAAEKLAQQYGAKAFTNPQEALQDPKVEAVVIVSPTATHTEIITLAAKAKLPIFCEKPIDLSIQKTDQCLQAVEKNGVPLSLLSTAALTLVSHG